MKTTSLHEKLHDKFTQEVVDAEASHDQAKYNLSRLSLIYSGQLYFQFEDGPFEDPPQPPPGEVW